MHSEWYSPTLYSYICDLKTKTVYVYNFHNFEEEVEVDLGKELKEGKHYYDLPSLFLVKTQAANQFERYSPKSGADNVIKILNEDGIEKAVSWYKEVKDETFSKLRYRFRESEFNSIAYRYLGDKEYTKAIAVFTFNTKAYPRSANAWDSLAEAYMIKGENEKAIKFYKKALELNPENAGAKKNIKILQKKQIE